MPTAGEYKHEPSGIPCHCFVRRRIRHSGRRKSCLRQPHLDRPCKSKTVTFNPVLCVRSYDGDAKSDHEQLCIQLEPTQPPTAHSRSKSPPPSTSTAGARTLCDKITSFLGFKGSAKHACRSKSRRFVSRLPFSREYQDLKNNEIESPDRDTRSSSPEPLPRYQQLYELTNSSISHDLSGFNGADSTSTEHSLSLRSSDSSNFESSDLSLLPRYSRSPSDTTNSSRSSRSHSSIKRETSQTGGNSDPSSFMYSTTSKSKPSQHPNSCGSSTVNSTNPNFTIPDEGCPTRRDSPMPHISSDVCQTVQPSRKPPFFSNSTTRKSEPSQNLNSFDSSTANSTIPSHTIPGEGRPTRQNSSAPQNNSNVSHRDVSQLEQPRNKPPSFSYCATRKNEPNQNPNRSESNTANSVNPSFKIPGEGCPTMRDSSTPHLSSDISYCNVCQTESSNASFRAEGDEHERYTRTTVCRNVTPTVVGSSGESSVKPDEDMSMDSRQSANYHYAAVKPAMRRRTESEHLDNSSTVPAFSARYSTAPSMHKIEVGSSHSAVQQPTSRVLLSAPNPQTTVTSPYNIELLYESSKLDAQRSYGNTNFFTQPAGNPSLNQLSVKFAAIDVLRMTWIVLFWTGCAFLIALMYVFAFTCPRETE